MLLKRVSHLQIKNSMLSLIVAIFPGLQKVIILSCIMHFSGSESVGEYVTLIALPTFICLLTGVGFGGKLLKLLPGEPRTIQNNCFNKIASASLIYIFVTWGILLFLYILSIIERPIILSIYLLCITLAQLIRHYYLATSNLTTLVLLETIHLVVLTIPIIFLDNINTYIVVSSLMMMSLSCIWYSNIMPAFRPSIQYLKDCEIIQLSANSVFSAGVLVLTPLALDQFYSKAIVGEVSLIMAFFSLFLLVPRAFVNFKTPILIALLKNNASDFISSAMSFQKQFSILTMGFLLFCFLICFITIHFQIVNYFDIAFVTEYDLIAVVFFVFSGSFGVSQGLILFVLSKQKFSLFSNIYFFFAFMAFVTCVNLIDGLSLSLFFIISSLISFSRFPYVFFYAKQAINNMAELRSISDSLDEITFKNT